jgi:hypothetical protein
MERIMFETAVSSFPAMTNFWIDLLNLAIAIITFFVGK